MSRPIIQIGPKAAGQVLTREQGLGTDFDLPGPLIQGTALLNGGYHLSKTGYTSGGQILDVKFNMSQTDIAYLKQLMRDSNEHTLITPEGVFDGYIKQISKNSFKFWIHEQVANQVDPFLPSEVEFFRAYLMAPWPGMRYDDDDRAWEYGYRPYSLKEITVSSISMSSSVRELDTTSNHVLNMFVQVVCPVISVADLIVDPYLDLCVNYVSYVDTDGTETSHYSHYGIIDSVDVYEGASNQSLVIQARISMYQALEFFYFETSELIRDRSSSQSRFALNVPTIRMASGPASDDLTIPDKAVKRFVAAEYYNFNYGNFYTPMNQVRYDINASSKNILVSSEV